MALDTIWNKNRKKWQIVCLQQVEVWRLL